MTTMFHEGDSVTYTGTAMPPAQGKLLYFASDRSAHVQWAEGARNGEIDLVDIYDITPVTSSAAMARIDPMGRSAVRRAMEREGESGVLNFLVTAGRLSTWTRIAADVQQMIESRLRVDASMEQVFEQLRPEEADRVISLAARTLVRDMGEDDDS